MTSPAVSFLIKVAPWSIGQVGDTFKIELLSEVVYITWRYAFEDTINHIHIWKHFLCISI